jgi:hypothetical protein
MAGYGNARHPARDTPSPDPRGPAIGSNDAAPLALTHGPSAQAIQLAATMGLAVNTASPMSAGHRVWGGDEGYGVHRWAGRLPMQGNPAAGAVAPVAAPSAVRYGTGGGPSQAPGYPSTGGIADFASRQVAALDMKRLGSLGYGG